LRVQHRRRLLLPARDVQLPMSTLLALLLVSPSPAPRAPYIVIPDLAARPTVVFCSTSWCVHCPAVAELLSRTPGIRVLPVKDDAKLFDALGVTGFPTLIYVPPGGSEARRHVGRLDSKGLSRFLNPPK
jgi:hypothetical protein